MKKCIFYIVLLFSPFSSVASECEEPEWAKNLDCESGFRKYYEYLESNSHVVENMDENKINSLSEKVDSKSDRTIKCASISNDEKENDLLNNIIAEESSLISSIRAYLKFNSEGPYVAKEIGEHVASDYKKLVYSVAAYNKFINARQQPDRTTKNVASPQCGTS